MGKVGSPLLQHSVLVTQKECTLTMVHLWDTKGTCLHTALAARENFLAWAGGPQRVVQSYRPLGYAPTTWLVVETHCQQLL